jgi:hypothetical protein
MSGGWHTSLSASLYAPGSVPAVGVAATADAAAAMAGVANDAVASIVPNASPTEADCGSESPATGQK